MHHYGFSTGALAFGDFQRALTIIRAHKIPAVELSALRDHELPALMAALPTLDLSSFEYASVHAPSRFSKESEGRIAELLSTCVEHSLPIVLHPDAVHDPACWKDFGEFLCIENMDKRKPIGRTAEELAPWFDSFPDATFCLDLGHAKQVDPSLSTAHELVTRFGERLRQIHLSELDSHSRHEPLSMATVLSLRPLAIRLPSVAVIVESVVQPDEVERELEMARAALEPEAEPNSMGQLVQAGV